MGSCCAKAAPEPKEEDHTEKKTRTLGSRSVSENPPEGSEVDERGSVVSKSSNGKSPARSRQPLEDATSVGSGSPPSAATAADKYRSDAAAVEEEEAGEKQRKADEEEARKKREAEAARKQKEEEDERRHKEQLLAEQGEAFKTQRTALEGNETFERSRLQDTDEPRAFDTLASEHESALNDIRAKEDAAALQQKRDEEDAAAATANGVATDDVNDQDAGSKSATVTSVDKSVTEDELAKSNTGASTTDGHQQSEEDPEPKLTEAELAAHLAAQEAEENEAAEAQVDELFPMVGGGGGNDDGAASSINAGSLRLSLRSSIKTRGSLLRSGRTSAYGSPTMTGDRRSSKRSVQLKDNQSVGAGDDDDDVDTADDELFDALMVDPDEYIPPTMSAQEEQQKRRESQRKQRSNSEATMSVAKKRLLKQPLGDDDSEVGTPMSRDGPAALTTQKSAVMEEIIVPLDRAPIFDSNATLALELDEVAYRDMFSRTQDEVRRTLFATFWTTMALQESHNIRKVEWSGFMKSQLLQCENLESLGRIFIENLAFRASINIWEDADRYVSFRQEWEGERKRMEQRHVVKSVERNVAAGEAASKRASERRADKVSWQLEKKRLEEGSKQRDESKLSTKQKLREQLAAAKAAAPKMVPHWKALDKIKAISKSLGTEEERSRGAVEAEWSKRWRMMWDEAVQIAPDLVAHPQRQAQLERKQAEIAKAKHDHEQLMQRCKDITENKPLDKRVIDSLQAHLTVVMFDEEKQRRKVVRQEKKAWEELLHDESQSLEVVKAHDARRAAVENARQEQERLEQEKKRCAELLNHVVESCIVRRRLGQVYKVRDEARMLLDSWRRKQKEILRAEYVVRGDLEQYIDLQMTMMFPTHYKHNVAYTVTPDCVPNAESLTRELLVREFHESFQREIAEPFNAGEQEVLSLPPEKVGLRLKSVKKIQNAYRGYKNKQFFINSVRDDMILRRMSRLKFKSNSRILRDQEQKARIELEDEYAAADLYLMFQDYVVQAEKERLAAIRIQSMFRGWKWRCWIMPKVMEMHFLEKLKKLKARDKSKSPQ